MTAASTRKPATATRIVRRTGSAHHGTVEADICVIGSGAAGISAALEATRLGRKVALIDSQPQIGGQAVNSIIGTFCGFYSNSLACFQTVYGIAGDILRDLGAAGALHFRRTPHTTVVMYDEVALSRWIEEQVRQAGITVVLGAVLRQAQMSGRRIERLELATRYGDLDVTARGFVDASGDAALAWLAGLPCREAADGPVYGTQMVVLENVDEAHHPVREEMTERLAAKGLAGGLTRIQGFSFLFQGRGTALVNLTHVETPLEPVAASRLTLEGKAQADTVVAWLRAEYPKAFAKAKVRGYGAPGIRQTRWIAGKHQITVDEVRRGVKYPDAIARTSWPIELHDTPQGYVWEQFGDDHMHYVPFASLVSPEADNYVAAGRCIDGDTAALSSVRVMGPCIAMGAAAAHALDIAGDGSVHQIDMSALKTRVRDNVERRD